MPISKLRSVWSEYRSTQFARSRLYFAYVVAGATAIKPPPYLDAIVFGGERCSAANTGTIDEHSKPPIWGAMPSVVSATRGYFSALDCTSK